MATGNDYNISKQTPTEVIVSRTLQAKNRNWSNVVWRTGKPPLDSEWNLINDMATETVGSLIKANCHSGWTELGTNFYSSGYSSTPNTIEYYSGKNSIAIDEPNALVNGWPVVVGGVNFTDTSKNKVTLLSATGVARWDFVFLEVWRTMVRSRDNNNNPISYHKPSTTTIYSYGNTQFGGTNFTDDIVDYAIKPAVNGIETSERVQVQYRIRVATDVSFSNVLSDGFSDTTKVQGQGAAVNPQITGYAYTNMKTELGDSGLWRSGTGDDAARTALETVDGYTYAIPMFKIYRRSTVAWSDTGANPSIAYANQQGNSAIIGGNSDRPDSKFNDGIDASDIMDLRHEVSLSGINYNVVLEKNLHKLLEGSLVTAKTPFLQYDLIADSDVYGYTDFLSNEGCHGKRTTWSDRSVTQTNIFAEVSISQTDSTLDAYRSVGAGAWAKDDTIVVQPTTRIVGGVIDSTVRVYIENKSRTDVTSQGVWETHPTILGAKQWRITVDPPVGMASYDVWIYYDIILPEAKGISYVPDEALRFDYANYYAFPTASANPGGGGYVVSGLRHDPTTIGFQDFIDHPLQNIVSSETVKETEVIKQYKQFQFSPLIRTASSINERKLEVRTTDKTLKTIYIPYPIQHLKGVYDAATGGNELATQVEASPLNPNFVDVNEDSITVSGYYICELTNVTHVPTSTNILIDYGPVYEHGRKAEEEHSSAGTKIKFYKRVAPNAGSIWNVPSGAVTTDFRYTGRRIKVRSGSGYGMDVGFHTNFADGFFIDCQTSTNNGLFGSMSDNQQVWLDMDYFGAPHKGAEVRIIYSHIPYQGMDVGGMTVRMEAKRDKGLVFNNGTGGGTLDTTGSTGTSNYTYSPISTKLPGTGSDYLRDGDFIEIGSVGTPRKDTDAWFFASYDLYGYHGGGVLFPTTDFTFGSLASGRGFEAIPYLKAIFEGLTVSQTNAAFVLPLLVRNIATDELFLMVQVCNNTGGQTGEMLDAPIRLELYRLDGKLLIK